MRALLVVLLLSGCYHVRLNEKTVKEDVSEFKPEQKEELKKVIIALSAEARLKAQRKADSDDAAAIAEGRKLISAAETMTCIECHKFAGEGKTKGPDLTGYGSTEWMTAMISNPAHKRFYGDKNDRMPAFALHPNDPTLNRISPQELAVLVSWLRGEWYEPAPHK